MENALYNIELENFKSHEHLLLNTASLKTPIVPAKAIFIYGPNGSGKTSILDAIALLCGAKSFKKISSNDYIRRTQHSCKVQAKIQESHSCYRYEMALYKGIPLPSHLDSFFEEKQAVTEEVRLIDGVSASKNDQRIESFFINPSIDFLLLKSPSYIRNFFDFLIGRYDPYYTKGMKHYEKLLKDRFLILNSKQEQWVESNEKELTLWAIRIYQVRKKFIQFLNITLQQLPPIFSKIQILSKGWMEEQEYKENFSNQFKSTLYRYRSYDKDHGGAFIGPQKSNLTIMHTSSHEEDRSFKTFSSGEQKLALLSLYAALLLMDISKGKSTLVLLDEWHAHLDHIHGESVFQFFIQHASQVWATATDRDYFPKCFHDGKEFSLDDCVYVKM